MIYRRVLLAALLPLAACSGLSPEARVQAGLEKAGLSPRMARCMAPRLVERLSGDELRKLGSLGGVTKDSPREMSLDELLFRIRALDDPHIVKVVSKAGLVCVIQG
jgi:hypothetical protein